ncbi:hypothetical protein PC116_g18103 [Phytophthora cactorum]|uniref:MULE transposase domain-containing protein n=1 Tax=Phytophthora cactorum TaxID=29920 RepID=A0A8T1KCL5_9STRA|nr:hypothetical protein PC114_g12433 [Phytophthora cactorum]KAG2916020.1 hypothetical protein PC115_g11211 [Phytophthora cactorum]KAG2927824.1 hypothetical protein PC117_g14480 [Phytophthora cactorum]KAG3153242.1 hypothetical protein C6341_g16005 [Phytophthora cactorum]KAG4233690.1 hypothetical protein PC116_g18103 [Phytophthora cactorum]
MFASLKSIYFKVMLKSLALRYVMGDADGAQFNAVMEALPDRNVENLMCFWHMITKLYEHDNNVSPAKLALVAADVYEMHYATSESHFHARKSMAVRRWVAD